MLQKSAPMARFFVGRNTLFLLFFYSQLNPVKNMRKVKIKPQGDIEQFVMS
jgi:hypothetical protein